MPVWAPLIEPVTVSVAVIDWLPTRLEGHREHEDAGIAAGVTCGSPASAAAPSRARDSDGARVAGRRVAELVLGGDGDVVRSAGDGRVGEATDDQVSRDVRGHIDRALGAVDGTGCPCRSR